MTIDTIWTPETQQQLFRRLLTATARPGSVLDISALLPAGQACTAVLATLVDGTVLLSDPHHLLDERTWQFTRAIPGVPEKAAYIVARGDGSPDFEPSPGTLDSPELGATLILMVARLGGNRGERFTCSGPGIATSVDFQVDGLDPEWLACRERWNSCFPLGVDFLLVDPDRIMALPRTTRIAEKGV